MCEIIDDKNAKTQISKSIIIYELPSLVITGSQTICLDKEVKLIASYTITNSEIQVPIEWRMPNGQILDGREIATTFSSAGIQKIEAVALHPKKQLEILSKKEVEIFVNREQIAIISDVKDAFIGGANDNILFDASESYDPDGSPLTYYWDMGDGNKYEGVKVFHTYLNSGNYKVRLTVSDNTNCDCSEDVISKSIKVINRK